MIKNTLTGISFNDLPEKENDDIYVKFFETKELKYFNIIRDNGEDLEYRLRDSKDLKENNPKVRNLITKFREKGNKDGKILKETGGFILIHKINNTSFAVLMFSKPNYSEIIFKK
ncbi:hypothetical protein [Marinilabilia sp.]|uniref:hypothetical protein n=1 Tax=Marinilabilia sp. TaxID=2021252 RepID=UPI0025C5BB46|nr:hypothetical protein [Marinilabilia sp.]